jgi:anti-sigma regulatory factor (Ser/Thr protein kinase)
MRKTNRKKQIRDYLVRAIGEGRTDVAGSAAARFGVTRQYANKLLRELADEGAITASGETRARTYELVTTSKRTELELDEGLEEDRVWRESVQPELEGIGGRALDICHYGFTEMFNNVLDHSEGTRASVRVERNPTTVTIEVADDGVGIFEKIQRAFGLEDPRHAVLELSKGKLTTDPEAHTGEGIFFTSRMFDEYGIHSADLTLVHIPVDTDWLIEDVPRQKGTVVRMTIDPRTRRTVSGVFDRYAGDEKGDYGFNVTHVPVGLARYGQENLISRSQAKRVLARLDLFRRVVLDFSGVETIGQAFADEMFRVYPGQHPDLELVVVDAGPGVEPMIRHALSHPGNKARVTLGG